jgi:hypothetical protein
MEMAHEMEQPPQAVANGHRVTAYAEWIIRWRWLVIVATVVVAVVMASGVQFLGFSTNYRVFFSAENPQLQAFDALQKIYIRDDNIAIVIHPANGEVFTPDLLSGRGGLAGALHHARRQHHEFPELDGRGR